MEKLIQHSNFLAENQLRKDNVMNYLLHQTLQKLTKLTHRIE